MKLHMQVGLGPGHIVLDGDPAPPKDLAFSYICSVTAQHSSSASDKVCGVQQMATQFVLALFAFVVLALVFGRSFVKRFALCYQTVVLSVCLSCLSVSL